MDRRGSSTSRYFSARIIYTVSPTYRRKYARRSVSLYLICTASRDFTTTRRYLRNGYRFALTIALTFETYQKNRALRNEVDRKSITYFANDMWLQFRSVANFYETRPQNSHKASLVTNFWEIFQSTHCVLSLSLSRKRPVFLAEEIFSLIVSRYARASRGRSYPDISSIQLKT